MTTKSLAESANRAYQLANQHCAHNEELGHNCSWYHGSWMFFRALGLVSDPSVHQQFFIDAFNSLVNEGNFSRILVSGAVDFSMLETVLQAYKDQNEIADITAVDICQTPLELTHHYARQQNINIQTITSNILDYFTEKKFDVICTHAFMGNFDQSSRQSLINRWASLLRVGGKVITIQRIRPDFTKKKAYFSTNQATVFIDEVYLRAVAKESMFELNPKKIQQLAATYTKRFYSYPVTSDAELKTMFLKAGFKFDKFKIKQQGKQSDKNLSGPTVPDSAEYLYIIAEKKHNNQFR